MGLGPGFIAQGGFKQSTFFIRNFSDLIAKTYRLGAFGTGFYSSGGFFIADWFYRPNNSVFKTLISILAFGVFLAYSMKSTKQTNRLDKFASG